MARLRFFGPLREVTKTPDLEVEAPTVDAAVAIAADRFGEDFTRILSRSRIWVNGEPSVGSRALLSADEVAILPPVSGG